MFGKSNKQNKHSIEEKVLDVNASMQGTISFREPVNLKINGHFEGMLDLRGSLTIGPEARVNANINGDEITIAGKVHGDINAKVRLKLTSTAHLVGNIKSPLVSIEEGARFHGNCQMLLGAARHAAVSADSSFMSIEELAQFLEVDNTIVKDWAKIGKIPALKEGNSWKFERDKIEKWLASEQVK
jgi:excisionase family DNA binding protein